MSSTITVNDPRHGPKDIRPFPDSIPDTAAREAHQAIWDDWAQGRFVADIPIRYRPVQVPDTFNTTPPFTTGDHTLLVTDATFQGTAASRSNQVGEITDIFPQYSLLLLTFWQHSNSEWLPDYRLAYYDEVLNIDKIPTDSLKTTLAQVSAIRDGVIKLDPPSLTGLTLDHVTRTALQQYPWFQTLVTHDYGLHSSLQDLADRVEGFNDALEQAVRHLLMSTTIQFPIDLDSSSLLSLLINILQLAQSPFPVRTPDRLQPLCDQVAHHLRLTTLPVQATAECVDLLLILASIMTIGPSATFKAFAHDDPRQSSRNPTLADFFYAHGGKFKSLPEHRWDFTTNAVSAPTHEPLDPLALQSAYQTAIAQLRPNPQTKTPPVAHALSTPNETTEPDPEPIDPYHNIPEIAALQSVNIISTDELSSVRRALAETQTALTSSQQSHETDRSELQRTTQELTEARAETQQLRQLLETTQARLETALTETVSLRDTTAQATKTADTLRHQLANTDARFEASQQTVRHLSQAFIANQAEIPQSILDGFPPALYEFLQSPPVLTYVRSVCQAFDQNHPHWQVIPDSLPAPTLSEVIVAFHTRDQRRTAVPVPPPTTLSPSGVAGPPQPDATSPEPHVPPPSNSTASDSETADDLTTVEDAVPRTILTPNPGHQVYTTSEDTLLLAWETLYRLLWPKNTRDLLVPRNFGYKYVGDQQDPQSIPKHYHVLIMGLECIRYAMSTMVQQITNEYQLAAPGTLHATLAAYRTYLTQKKNSLHAHGRFTFFLSRLAPAFQGFLSEPVLSRIGPPVDHALVSTPKLTSFPLQQFLLTLQDTPDTSVLLPEFCRPLLQCLPADNVFPLRPLPDLPPGVVRPPAHPTRKRKQPSVTGPSSAV